MKTKQMNFPPRSCTLAVLAALAFLASGQAARADEEKTAEELTTPAMSVEAGVVGASRDSSKAQEYSGINSKTPHLTGGMDLNGGGAFDSNDATRWRIRGTDLGLQTRDLQAEYGEQGKFRFNLGFDEISHLGSDSFMTPYTGINGTRLTLPGNWNAPLFQTGTAMSSGTAYPAPAVTPLGLAATSSSSPLVTNAAYLCKGTTLGCAANAKFGGAYTTGYPGYPNAISPDNQAMFNNNLADLKDYHAVNLSTKRDKYSFGGAVNFSRKWDASFGVAQENKTGLREQGVVMNPGGAATSNNVTYSGEVASIIPRVIDYSTTAFNAALNFRGEKSFVTVAYYGQLFTNHAKSMTIDNPVANGTYGAGTAAGGTAAVGGSAYGPSGAQISEEPDSTFNQLRLTGGYDFTTKTHFVGDVSYSRNAQNDPYVLDPGVFATPTGAGITNAAVNNAGYVPVTSANGLVVNKTLDLKLTSKLTNKLSLTGAYKYDDRANQTPVNTYVWYDIGAKNTGTATGTFNGATIPGVSTGTPIYSGANITANRPYDRRDQVLSAAADYAFLRGQAIKVGVDYHNIDRHCTGTWTDCSFADSTRETTEKLEYRFHAGESLSGRLGAEQGFRHVDYNNNAWMAVAPAMGATNIQTSALLGAGYSGSVLGFLNAHGLTAQGLPIPAAAASPFSGTTLAVYQALFGANNNLSKNYEGINNVTNNWNGLEIYNMATRNRSRFRGALDWAATDQFTIQFSGDYKHDKYPNSTYGLQKTDAYSLNLDGDYAASETLSLSAYLTYENQLSASAGNAANNGSFAAGTSTSPAVTALGPPYTSGAPAVVTGAALNGGVFGNCTADSNAGLAANPTYYQVYNSNQKTDACTNWTAAMRDKVDTLGLALTKRRFLTPKLTVRSDVSYTRATTTNSMTGGSYSASGYATYVSSPSTAPNAIPAVYYIKAASLPDVVTTTVRLRLTGDYQLTKASSARLSYMYTNLHVNDYQYSTNLPANTSSNIFPDFEASPSYAIHVIGVSYMYKFQ